MYLKSRKKEVLDSYKRAESILHAIALPATPVGKATKRSKGASHLLGSRVTGSE